MTRTTINRWLARLRVRAQGERGLGLIESMVAVAVLGTAVVAFVTALSTGSIAVRESEYETIAQRLAQAELENIKSYTYNPEATTYSTDDVDTPEGYSISVAVSSIPGTDTDIQKITVAVSLAGEDILPFENYKVNR